MGISQLLEGAARAALNVYVHAFSSSVFVFGTLVGPRAKLFKILIRKNVPPPITVLRTPIDTHGHPNVVGEGAISPAF